MSPEWVCSTERHLGHVLVAMDGSTVSDDDLRDLYPSVILDPLILALSSHYRIHPSLSVGKDGIVHFSPDAHRHFKIQ